jgi:diguanylate cyclase (GGDEF)-like protein
VIKDAAGVLRGIFREGDVVARIGGDELVALLPNFSPAARDPLLERLAAAIRSHVEREARPFRLSLSAGVTFMEWDKGQTLDELLATADRSMYERKRERAAQPSQSHEA